MNIQAMTPQSFKGAEVVLSKASKKATYYPNLEKFLNKNQYVIENYADKHGFKKVMLDLRDGVKNKYNEHGDCLIIGSGPEPTVMKFDNTTSEAETSATILGNIQKNYNLIHRK